MKKNREIHAIDMAICRLITTLNKALHHLKDWVPLCRGVKVEIYRELHHGYDDGVHEVHVRIYPVEWPNTSKIYVRLMKLGGDWRLIEGSIWADHIGCRLPESFIIEHDSSGAIDPRSITRIEASYSAGWLADAFRKSPEHPARGTIRV